MSFTPQVLNFYTENHRWLETWLSRKSGLSSEAADIVQDVFTSILSKPSCEALVAELIEPRAYLTTVAKGMVSNYFKRKSLEQAYLEALANHPEATLISVEDKYILLELLYTIDQVLDKLPQKVRHVFLLSQLEGLSYGQIADKLKVNERTIKRYMAKAYEHCLMSLDL